MLNWANVRVDAPAMASLNSTTDVVAGCHSRLVRLLLVEDREPFLLGGLPMTVN